MPLFTIVYAFLDQMAFEGCEHILLPGVTPGREGEAAAVALRLITFWFHRVLVQVLWKKDGFRLAPRLTMSH